MFVSGFYRYKEKHPYFAAFIRLIFSRPLLVDSPFYRRYVFGKAALVNSEPPHNFKNVTIETTLTCNAHCLMCAHHDKKLTGIMDMELFKKIINECISQNIKHVGLGCYGEPMMDPYFIDRIKYLREFRMTYELVTNGSLFTEVVSRKLLEFGGMVRIQFSANGYDSQVYSKLMGGLDRDITYGNILAFLRLKNEYGQEGIHTVVSTVRLDLNKQDIKQFIPFWRKQKGVDEILCHDLEEREGNGQIEEVGRLVNFSGKNYRNLPCRALWERIYIYYDGRVGPCCVDLSARRLIVGDVNKDSLEDIFISPQLKELRNLHACGKREDHSVCKECSYNAHWFYRTRKSRIGEICN